MNERIKELAEQAGFMEAWFSESGDDCEREITKLAELIVRECVSTVNDCKNITRDELVSRGYKDWNSYKGALDRAKKKIRKHFGVEE